jgi:hypothetical protein
MVVERHRQSITARSDDEAEQERHPLPPAVSRLKSRCHAELIAAAEQAFAATSRFQRLPPRPKRRCTPVNKPSSEFTNIIETTRFLLEIPCPAIATVKLSIF